MSAEEDSARWAGLVFRQGDIVVSTRSKHGTTWVQTILLLLIHQQPDLPAPLTQLSPWLDHLVEPLDAVLGCLEQQSHRRVIKTHTPLDGVPVDPRVTYVVVARHPLDAAVSLYHQSGNLDRDRLRHLTGAAPEFREPRPPVEAWLREWVLREADPHEALDSLPGVLWHLDDAWSRCAEPNVVLVHYADLLDDLRGEMRRLAQRLGIEVAPARWDVLVEAATFGAMRARADRLAPDAGGVLRDRQAFFRAGRSAEGTRLLDPGTRQAYHARCRSLAGGDLLRWLHR